MFAPEEELVRACPLPALVGQASRVPPPYHHVPTNTTVDTREHKKEGHILPTGTSVQMGHSLVQLGAAAARHMGPFKLKWTQMK